jgi:TetR/AcrR family transcriptional repressor of mexJK operon
MREATPRRRAGRLASAEPIMEAAATLFLRNGYLGTSMDEIAALARVSKQTVYTHFADKERLFTDLVLRNAVLVDEFLDTIAAMLRNTTDVEKDLGALARQYVRYVTRPQTLQLRRLLIGEAGRFPELARAYYERVPQRVVATLASEFAHLTERGLLHTDDPRLAADHFAWLILGMPMDRAMFLGADDAPGPAQLDRFADAGVSAFLSAYRPR